jgi:hypothetical protein
MPNWKKVVVSGSNAELNQVTASYYSGDGSALTGVGGTIAVEEEGSQITSAVSTLDFIGSSVTAAADGGAVTVTISGGSGLDNAWDEDINEDLMPASSNQIVDVHYELDGNNDIMPRV